MTGVNEEATVCVANILQPPPSSGHDDYNERMAEEERVTLEFCLKNPEAKFTSDASREYQRLTDSAADDYIKKNPGAEFLWWEFQSCAGWIVADRHGLAKKVEGKRDPVAYLKVMFRNAFTELFAKEFACSRQTFRRDNDRAIRSALQAGQRPDEVVVRLEGRGISVEQDDVDLVAAVLKFAGPTMKAPAIAAAVLAETGIEVAVSRVRIILQKPRKQTKKKLGIVPSRTVTVPLDDVTAAGLKMAPVNLDEIDLPETFPVEDEHTQERRAWSVFRLRVFELLTQGLGVAEICGALRAGRRRVEREIRRISAASQRGEGGLTEGGPLLAS